MGVGAFQGVVDASAAMAVYSPSFFFGLGMRGGWDNDSIEGQPPVTNCRACGADPLRARIDDDAGNEKPNVTPADLVIIIDEKAHPSFKRDGNDLIYKARVPLLQALLGTTVNLTTLDGRNLTIPVPAVITPDM